MRERDFKIILLLADILACAAFTLLMPLFMGNEHSEVFPWARPFFTWVNLSFLTVIMLNMFGDYRNRWSMSLPSEILGVIKSSAIISLILAVARSYFAEANLFVTPPFILFWFFGSLSFFISLERFILYWIHRDLVHGGKIVRRAIIVGAGEEAQLIITKLRHEPNLGVRMVAQLASGEETIPTDLPSIHELRDILLRTKAEDIVVAVPPDSKVLNDIITACTGIPVTIKTLPDLLDIAGGRVRAFMTGSMPLVELSAGTALHRYMRIKRLIDIIAALILLVLSTPLWLILFPIVRIQTKGSLLYRQERVGQDGRRFKMIKFRSMTVNAEAASGPVWAGENDPRIVPIGRLIRKLRIDEVPQFINVLIGDMSVVGPRPERPYFVNSFSESIPFYTRRLAIKPGISGWAQIQHKYDETLDDVKEKLKYDLYYIDNMCLSLDIEIFFRTIWVMLVGKGAK